MSFSLQRKGEPVNSNTIGGVSIDQTQDISDGDTISFDASTNKFRPTALSLVDSPLVFSDPGGVTIENGFRFGNSPVVIEQLEVGRESISGLAPGTSSTRTITFANPFTPNPPRVYISTNSSWNTSANDRNRFLIYRLNAPTTTDVVVEVTNGNTVNSTLETYVSWLAVTESAAPP